MHIYVDRFSSNVMGTFGDGICGNKKFYTVECEWLDNKPFVSCIPAGTYKLVPHDTGKRAGMWAMVNEDLGVYHHQQQSESTRYACLIHVANRASELRGCMAPGDKLSMIKREWAVSKSGDTLKDIMAMLPRDEQHQITIRWKHYE